MQTSMPWVKLQTSILDDPRMGRLTEIQRWRVVQLEALAGKCDCGGYLADDGRPLTLEDIAWMLRVDDATIKGDFEALTKAGFIVLEEGVWVVLGFIDRQGPSQAQRREEWNDRQRRSREKAKSNASVTSDKDVSQAKVTSLREEESREEKRREEEDVEPQKKPGSGKKNDSLRESTAPAPKNRNDSLKGKEVPAAVKFHAITGRWPAREIFPELAKIPEEDLDFWGKVILGWRGKGWAPFDVNGMLDWYNRREIPGQRPQPRKIQGQSQQPTGMDALNALESALMGKSGFEPENVVDGEVIHGH